MKLNLKACLGALCMLFSTTHASAIEEPTFSTADNPVWYNVKFTKGGHVLKANAANAVLTTADPSGADDCQWQLIGTKDDFKLLSKSGRYVYYKSADSRFAGGAESDAASLKLTAKGDAWEISRTGSNQAMNQHGGTGLGAQLGEWTSGDPNNMLVFETYVEPLPEGWPTFSEEGKDPVWHYIIFSANDNAIYDMGVGKNVKHMTTLPEQNANQWKITGTRDNCQFVNKDGHYLNGAGDRLTTSATPYEPGFSLVNVNNGAKLEIKNNRIKGEQCNFNMFGGPNAADAAIGFWTLNDGNNALKCMPCEGFDFAEIPNIEGSTTFRPEQPLTLWFTKPGSSSKDGHKWMDFGLPVGNGQLGAMVLGNVLKEDISVNEKTLWTGDTELRGSYTYGCYQNFGSLYVRSREEGISMNEPVKDYWRDLDLTTGIARVHYKNADGTSFDRKYFTSYPDNIIAAEFAADKSGAVSLNFEEVPGMARTHDVSYSVDGNTATIEFHGKFEIVSYCSVIKIKAEGENATVALAADGKSIDVKNADKVYAFIAGGTDYDPVTPSYTSGTEALNSNIEATAANALTKGWDAVLADHIPDYQSFFNRVEFNLEGAENNMPTNEMRDRYREITSQSIDVQDPIVKMLEMLYFHYGRFLEIGSSRGVDLPGNLQGIWSGYNVFKPYGGSQIAPWNGDIHSNINVQMCYWPCEPTNLSELHLPFLNYIINQATVQPQWQNYAKNQAGQTKGWTCFTENNIFGGTGGFMTNYVIANAWYCTHLWQHYAYTLDKEFLLRALPTMWSACEFWLERLKKAKDGTWECPNEYSPEHGPGSQNATAHSQQLVSELFSNVLEAAKILPDQTVISAAELEKLQNYYDNLDKGLRIEKFKTSSNWQTHGLKNGDPILKEWKYSPFTAGADQHRHISHLMCLYPYSQIEPGTPEFEAAVNSLRQRGDGATGWSIGWKINLWARAFDGDHARQILRNGLSNNTYNNLFDSHAPFQIDGNFGACAGIAEMLVQSRKGTIWVLPALPGLWAAGEVKGLKAEGDFTVDIKWADSHIELATITANQGGTLNLGNGDLVNTHIEVNGQKVEPTIKRNLTTGLITTVVSDLKAGDKVTMVYDSEYTQPDVKDEEMDSIAEIVAPDSDMAVSVSNGTVTVSGVDAASVSAYDMAGRLIASAAGNSVKVNTKGIVMITVTEADGSVRSVKASI